MVHADPNQLTVLLNNLVENALRYTPADGVVDVEACLVEGRPTLMVTDTGPGIPEADRGRVFDRFYRCEDAQSQARDGSGSGLGLAIVKSIADRHHARVVLSTPPSGQGLQARVIFPAG
jgi:two-component system OmpR family sensor kinase